MSMTAMRTVCRRRQSRVHADKHFHALLLMVRVDGSAERDREAEKVEDLGIRHLRIFLGEDVARRGRERSVVVRVASGGANEKAA